MGWDQVGGAVGAGDGDLAGVGVEVDAPSAFVDQSMVMSAQHEASLDAVWPPSAHGCRSWASHQAAWVVQPLQRQPRSGEGLPIRWVARGPVDLQDGGTELDPPGAKVRDPTDPPEEFIAYVRRCLPALSRATRAVAGNDQLADGLAMELLRAVALRWRSLSRDARQLEAAADSYLRKIWHRAARDEGTGEPPYLNLDGPERPGAPARATGIASERPEQVAAAAWQRAYRIRRRRLLVGGGAVAVLAALGLTARRDPEPSSPAAPSPRTAARPTSVPAGVDLLPAGAEDAPSLDTPIPRSIALDPPSRQDAGTMPPALALLHPPDAPPLALGPDGETRELPLELAEPGSADSALPGLTAGSLSANGRLAAFPAPDELVVLELTTGTVERYPVDGQHTAVVWLGQTTVLVGTDVTAVLVDLADGATQRVDVAAHDVLTPRGAVDPLALPTPDPASTPLPGIAGLIGLGSVGDPATAPARVLRFVPDDDTDPRLVEYPLAGELAGWVGPWRGPGFLVDGIDGVALRDAEPRGDLPETAGIPRAATVALHPTSGEVIRVLVGVDLNPPRAVGWLDSQTALVTATLLSGPRLLGWRVADGGLFTIATTPALPAMALSDPRQWE